MSETSTETTTTPELARLAAVEERYRAIKAERIDAIVAARAAKKTWVEIGTAMGCAPSAPLQLVQRAAA